MLDEMDAVFKILDQMKHFNDAQKRIFFMSFDGFADFQMWKLDLPYISWPSEWEVKFYPSVTAVLRGLVRLKSDPSRQVSFYFDGYCFLGSVYNSVDCKPIPYWEICDISDPKPKMKYYDIERYWIYEIDKLLEGIGRILRNEDKPT